MSFYDEDFKWQHKSLAYKLYLILLSGKCRVDTYTKTRDGIEISLIFDLSNGCGYYFSLETNSDGECFSEVPYILDDIMSHRFFYSSYWDYVDWDDDWDYGDWLSKYETHNDIDLDMFVSLNSRRKNKLYRRKK